MKRKSIESKLKEYLLHLQKEERSQATRQQYERDVRSFLQFAGKEDITKELVIDYKDSLQERYRPATVNAKLAAINGFFSFLGKTEWKVKQLKTQRQVYCSENKELSKTEYQCLIKTAGKMGNERIGLVVQTICATGIRVSELSFITVEAVKQGEATVCMKGKIRSVFLTEKLRKRLQEYIHIHAVASGPVFVTRSGKPLNRSNIWRDMKKLCKNAGVNAQKVFPHNLRHLFARCFYSLEKDIAKLADILGHSSIDTTRLYTISTGQEHRKQLEALQLVN